MSERIGIGGGGAGRLVTRFAASAVVVVATLVGAVSGVGGQEGFDGGGGDEVRIVARRVASGNVEFALQRRGGEGSDWGERLLPRQRFFPAGTAVGRWLVSTPLILQVAAGGDMSAEVAVRIVARRVASGSVEFALQRRGGEGSDWGERLLPRARFFPAGTAAGRWLVSTPLTLSAGETSSSGLLPPIDGTSTTTTTVTTTETTQPAVDLGERLAVLVLAGANGLRAGMAPLLVDDALSAAAQVRAEAMADAGDWLSGYSYAPHLKSDWDLWRTVRSAMTWASADVSGLAERLSGSLLAERATENLLCELCTHIGTGVATRDGWTYATAVVAGRSPAQRELEAAEAYMADLVNELRRGLGVDALIHDAGIAAVARRWSRTMGAEESLDHNPAYVDEMPPGWTRVGENVSQVPAPTSLRGAVRRSFDGLVGSPGHYANMTDRDYTHFGIGIAVDNGTLWVTQNFGRYPNGLESGGPEGDTGD